MSFQDTKTDWIWASGGNGPLNSDNVEQSLSRHNEAATFQFDLSKAVGASGANPFIDTTGATTTVTPTTTPGSSDSSDSSSSSSSSETDTKLANIVPAHAAVMSLAFLIFFPLGAIIMRIGVGGYTVFIHAALQIFSYMLAIAGTGLGIYMALTLDSLQSAHAIIGLITVVSLLIQAPLGLLHHGLHKKHGGRTAVSYVHIWLGRALITLGAINGGLGLQLADAASENRAGVIAYGVLAAVIYISYFAMIAATFGKGKKTATRHGPMRQYKTESTSQVS